MIRKVKSPKNENVVLGKISGSLWRKEEISEGQLNHHVHIVGASGFGKTVLISHIIQQRIEQGKGLFFIDLKSDIETLMKFTQFAAKANRLQDLQIFSLSEKKLSTKYNLIQDGSPTQLRDRIVSSLNWTEEYYKNQASSFLLKLLILLCWSRDHQNLKFDIATILNCASNSQSVVDLSHKVPMTESQIKSLSQDLFVFLKDKDSYNSLQGLRTQLESIVLSDFGDLVCANEDGINLFEAYKQSKIIFLFLDSRRYGETAKTIGKFILQDLKSVSAKVDSELPKEQRKPFSVIVDECVSRTELQAAVA